MRGFPIQTELTPLGAVGLQRFLSLREAAISVLVERFYLEQAASYVRFGDAGRDACKEDLAFHLDFLRPVLEFSLPRPMVDMRLNCKPCPPLDPSRRAWCA